MAEFIVPVAVGSLFTLASSLLTPVRQSESGRIETQPPTAEFGSPMPEVIGKVKLENCPMTWALPLEERGTTNRQRNFLGMTTSQQTTYEYYMTCKFDLGLEIQHVDWVWANGRTIYVRGSGDGRSALFEDRTEISYGTGSQDVNPIIQSYEGRYTKQKGISSIAFDRYPVSEFEGSGFPKLDVLVVGRFGLNPKVKDVIKFVCNERAGIPLDKIDVSALDETELRGCVLKNDGSTYQDFLEDLMQIYNLYLLEIGDSLVFKKQDASYEPLILDIGALGAREQGNAPLDLFKQTKTNYQELPSEVQVTFKNSDTYDQAQGQQSVRDPVATHFNQLSVNTSIVDGEGVMATAASRLLYQSQIQSVKYSEVILLPEYNFLKIGDLIVLPDPDTGRGQILQVSQKNYGSKYLVEIEAKRFSGIYREGEPFVVVGYNNPITVSNPYETPPAQLPPTGDGSAEILVLDIPLINNLDEDTGVYLAVKGDTGWRRGKLFLSIDGGATWQESINLDGNSVVGTVDGIIPTANPGLIDRQSTIRVVLPGGTEIDPATMEGFLQGENLGLFGDEIIAFRDVVIISNDPAIYDLSFLIRSIQGTNMTTHTDGETFVLLTDYLPRLTANLPVNANVLFKGVGQGRTEPSVTTFTSKIITLESLKPIPPSPVYGKKYGDDWHIFWFRQTRKNGNLVDYADINYAPGESGIYRIWFYDSSFILKREIFVEATYFVYSASEQITDFGGVQANLIVQLAQLSTLGTAPRYSDFIVL